MAEKRPPTGLQTAFGNAVLSLGSQKKVTSGSVKAGSENRGDTSSSGSFKSK